MKKLNKLFILFIILLSGTTMLFAQSAGTKGNKKAPPQRITVDTRVDNMVYWKNMARLGLVPVAPDVTVEKGTFTGSKIKAKSVITDDSPDVPLTTENSTQSENSIFADPNDKNHVLNSNNSTENPVGNLYGANDFFTFDGGNTWGGEIEGAGGGNSGDPTTAISNTGRMYVGYIHNNYGQGISYSTNGGQSWSTKLVAPNPGSMLDKNHLWIDNSTTSPYDGYVYDAWTAFGGSHNNQIEVSHSSDGGLTWSTGLNISAAINAGSHNQGVNLHTGPNGEVYAIWAVYDSWPSEETAIGFAKSMDGGATFTTAQRIITNIRGIRTSGTSKNQRVNSFPSMTVDISNGPNRGTIYVVWTNIGVPGVNTGSSIDVYMIKSTDNGTTWSTPSRINQDPTGLGKQHYFPWICCDPVSGTLSCIFYDDRNVSSTKCEVYVANSKDGGQTWEDFKVSDVSFTPTPIPGLADSYMGDYLGITAQDRKVYPVWSDNRSGVVMAYSSPFETGPPPNQPWVIFQSYQVNNADGYLKNGETAPLNFSMVNIGDQPTTNVDVTISSSSPFIQISDSTEHFGDFAVSDTITINNAFTITAPDGIPNGTSIPFTVTATDGDSTWISNFNVIVRAPQFAIGGMVISDPTGNGNGSLDPGETVDIHISTTNAGGVPIANSLAQLQCSDPNITVNSATYTIDSLAAGQTVDAIFNITVSPNAPINSQVSLNYSIASGLYNAQKLFTKKIGLIVEDFETGDFTHFTWIQGGTQPWTITNVLPYEGVYSAKSGTISNSQNTTLSLQINVTAADSISFYYKTSSESGWDYLKFYIDNTNIGQWSGETPWSRTAYPVTAGNHTFKWEYMKDNSVSNGSDCAWLDFIELPTSVPTGANVSGTITYANTANTPLNALTVKLKNGTGTVVGTTTTNVTGNYSFSTVPAGNYTFEVTTTKPWNGVSAADVLLFRKHIANVQFLNGIYLASGDVNLSGSLTAADVLIMRKRIANVISEFPSGNWLFNNLPFTVGNNNVTQNFNGIVYGDANGSYIPTKGKSLEIKQLGVISIKPVDAVKGEIAVPVYVSGIQNLGSFQFSLQYDANKLKLKDVSNWYQGIESVTVGNPTPGILTFVWAADVNPINITDGLLCNILFTSNSTDASNLKFTESPTSIEFGDYDGNLFTPQFVNGSVSSATAIGELNQNGLDIFPNPGKGIFVVKLNSKNESVNMKIVNSLGKVVWEEKKVPVTGNLSKTIDISNQPQGVYMLSVDDNKAITNQKIVIEK